MTSVSSPPLSDGGNSVTLTPEGRTRCAWFAPELVTASGRRGFGRETESLPSHSMRIRHYFFLLGAVLAVGCSEPTAPGPLDGAWLRDETIPGNSLWITLSSNGAAVSGTGVWDGEACCSGTVTVTGTTTGQGVTLTFTFFDDAARVPASSSQFTGKMTDPSTLSGTMISNGIVASVGFHRLSAASPAR